MAEEKLDITLAKGLGIFLVVVGHILAGGVSLGNEWFSVFVHYLYLFHMPFFMFISGYVFFRPGRLERLQEGSMPFIGKQAVRLLLPFFLIGLVILSGKFLMQSLMHVDNVPSGFSDGLLKLFWFTDRLLKLFWFTDRSPAVSIWYVFVLFIYNALGLFLFRVFGEKMKWWLVLGLVAFFVPVAPYLYMDRVAHFFIFFVVGGLLRHHEGRYLAMLDRPYAFWAYPLGFAALLFAVPYADYLTSDVGKLCVGLLSIPALHAPCRAVTRCQGALYSGLAYLGGASYVIYLFNTMCIGVTKGVLFKLTTWDGLHFVYVLPILVLSGIIGPVIIDWLFLSRVPFIQHNILGRRRTPIVER